MNPAQNLPGPDTPTSAIEGQIRTDMLHELYVRGRESTLLGFLPIFLLAWLHMDAHALPPLLLWIGSLVAVQTYRLWIAQRYLQQPDAHTRQRWYLHQWLGTVTLALGWVISFALLDANELGMPFYLHLIFLIGLSTFMLSSIGIDIRLYGGFLLVLVGGTLAVLSVQYPAFLQRYPIVPIGFVIYACMLLVRSRGEYRRTREWITARLNRKQLLEQLNAALAEERNIKEQLRQQSQELENRNRELSELAVRDGLTRAFRRGHIEAELRRLIKGLHRHHDNFSVLMMDIDFFKRVNDQYGHAVGDEVLRRLAAVSQTQLRETNLFGRWGGEEFIVLMPQTTLEEAVMAAQRLRQAIAAMVFDVEGATFQITISIGAAQLQPMESADAVVARSDEALYAAKHAGRNCVVASPALTAG
ncbi:MAG: diguanylate cyclase [Burkholderiales bacterium]|nr:diguanylate cyclase [Burkholderiales bacterium]